MIKVSKGNEDNEKENVVRQESEDTKMTKEEFEKNIGKKVDPEDYTVIEYVYTFHPSISETDGKKQIADLYKTFGMRVIKDMVQTAEKAEKLEAEIRAARIKLDNLKAEYEDLAK